MYLYIVTPQYACGESDDEPSDKVYDVMEEIEEATTPVYCSNESTEIFNSPRVICSISKLNKLIGIKCHMANCDGNYKLNFETSGCCLLIQGSCENGHSFNWTSSDVVHSSSGKKYSLITFMFHLLLCYLEIASIKLSYSFNL